ncbi:hypothetical protein HDU96_002373 [Phlyctochytrium bullatum]|nr:hypothetical protein HDU96_002373 [Phlyctochytrium bullatum]
MSVLSNNTWVNVSVIASVCAIGYLVYFDQRRQYDPEFRRRLRKERKLAAKVREEESQKEKARAKAALDFLSEDDEKIPTTDQEKQNYLTKQLTLAQQLLSKGPTYYQAAATCLYRAIKIYPEPLKLLMAFQETVPATVLDMIMGMMAIDVENAREGGGGTGVSPTTQELD